MRSGLRFVLVGFWYTSYPMTTINGDQQGQGTQENRSFSLSSLILVNPHRSLGQDYGSEGPPEDPVCKSRVCCEFGEPGPSPVDDVGVVGARNGAYGRVAHKEHPVVGAVLGIGRARGLEGRGVGFGFDLNKRALRVGV